MHIIPAVVNRSSSSHHRIGAVVELYNRFVCLPFVLHEMLGSVDAKLSEALESGAVVRDEGSRGVPDDSSLRTVLFACARAVSRHDLEQAQLILSSLGRRVSKQGDAGERVCFYFGRGLANRVLRAAEESEAVDQPGPSIVHPTFQIPEYPSRAELHAAYLALNRATPFLRFAHFTANQAIVEVMEGEEAIHLVDFEIMQGVQWPPLMQALAQRKGGPPRLRLTGIGAAEDVLHQTGHRLADFARTIDLPFEYLPLVVSSIENVTAEMLGRRQGEAFAVNCVLQLHRLLRRGTSALDAFLDIIQSLGPKVLTLVEREASHNDPSFLDRFEEAFGHYSTLFDSLEATLPPRSPDRLTVEEVWFGREIASIVSGDDESSEWGERHQRFERWKEVLHSAGFRSLPPSTFALAQAKLLLRLHHPSEGYRLFESDDCLLLGWQDRALFTVSSWQPQIQQHH